MVAIKTPPFQPLVENFAVHIYVTLYEALCMNEHLERKEKHVKLLTNAMKSKSTTIHFGA